MLETAKKVREPVAWLAVIGVGLGLLLGVIGQVQAIAQSSEWGASPAERTGVSAGEAALLLVLVGAAVLWAPAVRRAAALAWAAFGVVTLGLLAQLAFGIYFLTLVSGHLSAGAAVLQVLGLLLPVVVLAGVAWALFALARGAVAPAEAPAQPALEAHAPESATTWQPDQASGAAWTTASGAASGAQASGWGVPGQAASGWGVPQAQHQTAQNQYALPPSQQAAAPTGPGAGAHAAQSQASAAQPPQGPQIIYPDEASDTTQFRGSWDPGPRR